MSSASAGVLAPARLLMRDASSPAAGRRVTAPGCMLLSCAIVARPADCAAKRRGVKEGASQQVKSFACRRELGRKMEVQVSLTTHAPAPFLPW